ncbi:MAG: sugar phosphate isomerase/epimerase [Armatimonadetes bacterium]|nr:sugar phosphate isomerase/epimerase [Armatimonadota bacterium]
MKIALTATPSVAKFAPIVMRGDVADAFAAASELGYDGVELHLRQSGDIDRAALLKLMKNYTLFVPTLGTGMAAGEDGLTFSDPNPEVRRAAVERVRGHISLASGFGSAVTIGVMSGKVGLEPETRQRNRANAIECLREVCSIAESDGVTVLLEPLNRYECDWINTVDDGLAVIDEVGASNLKLLADTFHENIEEVDIPQSLKKAGGRLGHVHLVDSNRQAPGRGHLDLKAVVDALKEMSYKGWLSFEVLPIPSSRAAIEGGISTIRRLLG